MSARPFLLPGILLLLLISCAHPAPAPDDAARRALAFATSDDSDFPKLPPSRPSDWLAVHKEPGQTFDQYLSSRPLRPAKPRNVLVIQPLGTFDKDRKDLLDKASQFAGIFFQLEVRTENQLPLPPEKGASRVNRSTLKPQYLTDHILYKILLPRLPKDAYAYLGVTMSDLYPEESWNYVFGQASLTERVGVYSFIRYTPEFWDLPRTPDSDVLLLRRTCKVLSHETSHMFGLAHCTAYHCGMNGSNSLDESDRQPLFFCPVCLKKLQWNIGFDVLRRYSAMHDFFAANGMTSEADWLANRITKIKKASQSTP